MGLGRPTPSRRRELLLLFLVVAVLLRSTEGIPWKEFFKPLEEAEVCEANPKGIAESTAVLVITHSRDEYLRRTLQSILKVHPRKHGFPVVISQDKQDSSKEYPKVSELIQQTIRNAPEGIQLVHWNHTRPVNFPKKAGVGYLYNVEGYHKISRHYQWALHNIFHSEKVRRVIILEDDLELSVDFFEYFTATAPLLDNDPSLFCISGWNDNGKEQFVADPMRLKRTDWMPGIGFMITRRLWKEYELKWPTLFWDDWMRAPQQRKGRQCIYPEISREMNFGEDGVSRKRDFEKSAATVMLNKEFVPFTKMDLSFLEQRNYEQLFFERVANSTLLRSPTRIRFSKVSEGDILLLYINLKSTSQHEKRYLALTADPRHGIERTEYQGFLSFPQRDVRDPNLTRWVFLAKKDYFNDLEKLPGGFDKPVMQY